MKKYCYLILFLSTVTFSCKKEIIKDEFNLSESVNSLKSDSQFIEFTKIYLNNLIELKSYEDRVLKNNKTKFISEINNENLTIDSVEKIYEKYNLDFDYILNLQNEIDNNFLSIFNSKPELLSVPDDKIERLFFEAIESCVMSNKIKLNNPNFNNSNLTTTSFDNKLNKISQIAEITASEVWNCIKDAVGLGVISALSIKGIHKAGLKIITKTITKVASRFAGPIGVAIMMTELSFCLYDEAQD